MDDQTNDTKNDTTSADQAGRREFIKKMVLAGSFAAPVVATFARGVRGSSTLQAAADDAATQPVNTHGARLLSSRTKNAAVNVAGESPLRASNVTKGGGKGDRTTTTSTTRPPIVTSNVTSTTAGRTVSTTAKSTASTCPPVPTTTK